MELSDADSERIVAYLMAATPYGTVTENVITDIPNPAWSPGEDETEADRPTIQTQAWVSRPATPEETAEAYARSVLASLLDATVAFEKAQAAQAAANAVAPIVPV
jgi:hypothetical protein